jgi:DNA polymerase-4
LAYRPGGARAGVHNPGDLPQSLVVAGCMSGYTKRVRNLAVSVYDLIPHQSEQLEMFSSKSHAVADAMDRINDKYGEFVITPALMMGMDEAVIDRIAFGEVKELEELYQQ